MDERHRCTAAAAARALLLAAALALAGCAGAGAPDEDANGAATPSPGSSSPGAEEGTSPPFHAAEEPATAPPTGEAVLITDIRGSGHEGFDRLVLEYVGAGTPGWEIGYVDEARWEHTGEPVQLSGDVALRVRTSGTRTAEESDAEAFQGVEPGPVRITLAGTAEVVEVVHDRVGDQETDTFLALDELERRPFRAYLLEDPGRLVVEIQQTG